MSFKTLIFLQKPKSGVTPYSKIQPSEKEKHFLLRCDQTQGTDGTDAKSLILKMETVFCIESRFCIKKHVQMMHTKRTYTLMQKVKRVM